MRRRLLLFLALVGAALWFAWPFEPETEIASESTQGFANRVWVERMPKNERDMVRYFAAARKGKHRIGAVQRSSRWRVLADRFVWKLDHGKLELAFPQEKRKVSLQAKTWRCKGKAPKPFELCLELKQGDRKLAFYSMRAWTFDVPDTEGADMPTRLSADPTVPIPDMSDGAVACDDCLWGVPASLLEAGL